MKLIIGVGDNSRSKVKPIQGLSPLQLKEKGYTTLDHDATFNPDIVHDISKTPWPIKSGSVSHLVAENILEHITDTVTVMSEIHRVLSPSGVATITVPHFMHLLAWSDPDHRKAFTPDTMSHFELSKPWLSTHYSSCKFKVIRRYVKPTNHPLFFIFHIMPNNLLSKLSYFLPGIAESITWDLKKVVDAKPV